MEEVAETQAVADCFGRVARPYATLGGADGGGARLDLQDAVDDLVAVEEQVRPGGDEHPLHGARVEVLERVELLHERGDVDHHTVADEVLARLVDHAARQQVECVLVAADHQGVACVGTAVEAGAELDVLGEDVHELAFALVAPLGAQHHAELGAAAAPAVRRERHRHRGERSPRRATAARARARDGRPGRVPPETPKSLPES
mmetsp:Transcript_104617/g.295958  ORF Transcript_104617/g.295958 Transcript_104617/m.295958 type:complete len:203 (-) Transcript_104617:3-611(-)